VTLPLAAPFQWTKDLEVVRRWRVSFRASSVRSGLDKTASVDVKLPSFSSYYWSKAERVMVVAALIFGFFVVVVSLFFLLLYVRSNQYMRESQHALARQWEQQLKLQANLARMEMEARKYKEARQTLLKQGGGNSKRRDIEHVA
jgi:hypothetical protein